MAASKPAAKWRLWIQPYEANDYARIHCQFDTLADAMRLIDILEAASSTLLIFELRRL